MSISSHLSGLNINSPLVVREQANFLPSEWPPPSWFPVIIDATGTVVSRYSDATWNLAPWAGKAKKLNFREQKGKATQLSEENAELLRRVCAWWLWGRHSVRTASELMRRFEVFRPLFAYCSSEGVAASDLFRFPVVAEEATRRIAKSQLRNAISLMHDLWEHRGFLGFSLVDPRMLHSEARFSKHENSQTAYIPPRIWLYQLQRLRECIDDFVAHKSQLEDCFTFCLGAYAKNAGSVEAACSGELSVRREPFNATLARLSGRKTGCTFHGPFENTAERFGIRELLERWVGSETRRSPKMSINCFSSYFTLVTQVGIAYVINFSMMRVGEACSLRSDCHSQEIDAAGEEVHLLQGETTKTTRDSDARWITSRSVACAIEALKLISRLRMLVAHHDKRVPTTALDVSNPYLVVRSYEPWTANAGHIAQPLSIRPLFDNYGRIVRLNPKLFDNEEIRITEEDLHSALLFTPTLDPQKFKIGNLWPLAWHQLRRTGAVNMNASGVVSNESIQYQLKHASQAMSRYYGQGYYHLAAPLNKGVREEYLRAMYETISREFSELSSNRFVSPYGDQHKSRILKLTLLADHKALLSSAKEGCIAYREHLLGGCANPEPCDKGGVDSLAPCGSGASACKYLIYDRERLPVYSRLHRLISIRLASEPSSPLKESLEAQNRVLEDAINACK